jgi:hypothetical protein
MNKQYAALPPDLIHEVMMYAENELAALYGATHQFFGFEQAQLAAGDFLHELEVMEWPAESALPNWRQPALAAVRRLAERTSGLAAIIPQPVQEHFLEVCF